MAKKSFLDLFRDVFKPPPGPSEGDRKMDRRKFFRAGLAEIMKPLDVAMRPLENMAREVGKLDAMESSPPKTDPPRNVVDRPWLRPPGALVEADFRLQCSKCNQCVTACPVYAIRIDHSGYEGGGYPYIDVDYQACVLCDGQPCMPACPTGALQVTEKEKIDMGSAHWFAPTCLLTSGETCTVCTDDCPIGPAAINIIENRINVTESGCTGCGVCQSHCPTDPKSIIVIPKSSRGPR